MPNRENTIPLTLCLVTYSLSSKFNSSSLPQRNFPVDHNYIKSLHIVLLQHQSLHFAGLTILTICIILAIV